MQNKAQLKRLGATQQKILLLLTAGVALGLTRSPNMQIRVMQELAQEWQAINRTTLTRSVSSLYKSKLVKRTKHNDGTVTLTLTGAGKKQVLRYNLSTLRLRTSKRWDGKWRLVMYDIPEEKRSLRIELLRTLKKLGFFELQHSVFVYPYECKDEIEFLIEEYGAREYVRQLVVSEIDSPNPLLKHFKLPHK